MTDLAQPAGDGAYDLPPYDPYAGWDAPAPYIKPARDEGRAAAMAAGLLPDPAAAPQYFTPQPAAAAPVPQLTLMPQLPEQPLAEPGRTYALAPFNLKAKAMTIDGLILMVPTGIVLKLIWPMIATRIHSDTTLSAQVSGIAQNPAGVLSGMSRLEHWIYVVAAIATIVYWAVLAVYAGFFMSRNGGQTPGRTAAGIRVMREDGAPISFGWAVWRCVLVEQVLFTVLSLFTFGLATVAQYGWSLWDHDRRSLHDIIARSRVVVDAARIP